jgi:hypothetical protein
MDVSINDVADLHAGFLGDAKIRFNLLDGIAHGAQAITSSNEAVEAAIIGSVCKS